MALLKSRKRMYVNPPPLDEFKQLSGNVVIRIRESDQPTMLSDDPELRFVDELLCDLSDEDQDQVKRLIRRLRGEIPDDDYIENAIFSIGDVNVNEHVISATSVVYDRSIVIEEGDYDALDENTWAWIYRSGSYIECVNELGTRDEERKVTLCRNNVQEIDALIHILTTLKENIK